jgi:hypothetical protein
MHWTHRINAQLSLQAASRKTWPGGTPQHSPSIDNCVPAIPNQEFVPPPVDNNHIWQYVLQNHGSVHIGGSESDDSNPWGSLASFASQSDSDLDAEPAEDPKAPAHVSATYRLPAEVLLSQEFAVKMARNGVLICFLSSKVAYNDNISIHLRKPMAQK